MPASVVLPSGQSAPANSVASYSPAALGLKGSGRRGHTAKNMKRALKKAGLKTSGKKAALTRRVKKHHLKV